MKCFETSLPLIYVILYLSAHVISRAFTAHACTFPEYLQMSGGDEQCNWHTRVRQDGSRESCYSIRHNVLDISYSTSTLHSVRWKCSLTFHGKFLLRRRDPRTLHDHSACVKFIRRSRSIVQMMWSRESNSLDPALCEDRNLDLDPWPLVSFERVVEEYAPSPFRGGFSMRITDSEHGENGCNYMHRPMKFESDCLGGEGVLFDFISDNCLPTSVAMFVKQRTLTVANWMHGGDHYIILRRRDDQDLFCLRIPATTENHLNAFLFTDLACLTEGATRLLNVPKSGGVRYLVLHLQKYVYRHLCDDEYPQCSAVTCNSYIRHECHKSCKVCDVTSPPATCSFPRRLRGRWYQTDRNGVSYINITETDLTIDNVGSFRCVMFPDSPSRKSRMYTTVSLFGDGCRPRYTCLKLRRLGPSVLRYSLSRSYVWPDLEKAFGQAICSNEQFGMDPEPINDLYRSHEDTGKPIISSLPAPQRVPCNLSSSFTITATLPNGSLCHGSLHEHCEDSTRLRLQFHAGCGQLVNSGETVSSAPPRLAPEWSPVLADYSCLAHFEGHYWEGMLMLQNVRDVQDARCLLFTQLDASEALMMLGGQCDKHSWNYARAGLRTPLLSLQLRPDEFPCRYLPVTTTPPPTSPATSGRGRFGSLTWSSQPSDTVSFSVTVPSLRPVPGKHRVSAAYEEPKERERTPIDYNPELSPRGNEPGSGGVSGAARIVLVPPPALILLAACVDWINR